MKSSVSLRSSLLLIALGIGAKGTFAESPLSSGINLGEITVLAQREIRADRVPATDNSEFEKRRLVSPEPFTGLIKAAAARQSTPTVQLPAKTLPASVHV